MKPNATFLHSFSPFIAAVTLFVSMGLFSCSTSTQPEEEHPKPDGFFDYEAFEKDEKAHQYKEAYKEGLYLAEDGVNVDSIRNSHMKEHFRKRKGLRKRGIETLAGGNLIGEWFERGPTNEAGDLREVDYDPTNDNLYVISTVGHIYQGKLNGTGWTLLNDQIRFDTDVFNHVKKNGTDRLIAIYGSGKDNKKPRYSDDMGQTWTIATGIGNEFYDGWGGPRKMIEVENGKILYYMVHTWKGSPWGSAVQIYKSTNWGESYSLVLSMDGGGYNFRSVDMWKPHDSDNIYVLDNKGKKFYSITTNTSNGSHNLSSGQTITGLANGNVLLSGRYNGGNPTFYALTGGNTLYKSSNPNGSSWTNRSQVIINGEVESTFRNVFMANPFNNDIYMGGFQFYTSTNETTWSQEYSQWWEYYKKSHPLPERKNYMHVDMMEMELFRKADNTPFFIILNHAGIYASYDNMETTINLAQEGLNVVTLYDHATAPDGTIFFGAQDKGTFRKLGDNNANTDLIQSENQTTGDGMRELFFNNGNSWFGFLQNGSMYCMPDKNGSFQRTWKVPGTHIPGWINPVENHPDPAAKKCYVAGGNLNGGDGCYLIEMIVSWTGTSSNFQWNPVQYNYDFRANSNDNASLIRALSACKSDYNRLYVATKGSSNSKAGSFFYSTNGGSSWTKSAEALPNAFRAWDIAVSETNANKLYVCGTGFSNAGVLASTNGGQSFTALDTDAPLATYFDLVLSPDESMLFAATSEGPYVYVFGDGRWYDISGESAPYVDYRSVEYIQSIETVRFGTYGRGVWDFAIGEEQVLDCNGTPNGTAYLDYCNECVGGTTGRQPCQVPYATHVIPGIVELEEFDYGGAGVSFFDETEQNSGNVFRLNQPVDIGEVTGGGYHLGWTAADEWVEFTVDVQETGVYDLDFVGASPNGLGRFRLEMDGAPITASVVVSNSGGWDVYQTETVTDINLTQGTHIMRVYIESSGLNLDKFEFKKKVVTALTKEEYSRGLSVYPNPIRSGNTLSVTVPNPSEVKILNSKGEVLYKTSIFESKLINTDSWAPGTYLIEFNSSGNRIVNKVIIE